MCGHQAQRTYLHCLVINAYFSEHQRKGVQQRKGARTHCASCCVLTSNAAVFALRLSLPTLLEDTLANSRKACRGREQGA